MSYAQAVCGAEIQNYLKKFESKGAERSIYRAKLTNQIIIHRIPDYTDERWTPFTAIQIVDLDADGNIEIIGRYDDPKWHSYRNRQVILNSMSQAELDEIIDSGDVWPSRFFSSEKFKDVLYLYSENNASEIMPYHVLHKVLPGYKVNYKEVFLIDAVAYLLVAPSLEYRTAGKYFVFKLKGASYSEYCQYK
ncbi:hypothetical protein [Rheinheimera sp. F8]|uniref:hypothetical protein n=1 Tax=Rheinheimera sp. F8 TaxID=1763998 RepID=UPI000AECC64F|nr:hypothetical protein [Rheinheimera sp. F8]